MKSLKDWMRELGYQWVEGQEQLVKGLMSQGEAVELIYHLKAEGAVRNA